MGFLDPRHKLDDGLVFDSTVINKHIKNYLDEPYLLNGKVVDVNFVIGDTGNIIIKELFHVFTNKEYTQFESELQSIDPDQKENIDYVEQYIKLIMGYVAGMQMKESDSNANLVYKGKDYTWGEHNGLAAPGPVTHASYNAIFNVFAHSDTDIWTGREGVANKTKIKTPFYLLDSLIVWDLVKETTE
jgi:hypothetical protein